MPIGDFAEGDEVMVTRQSTAVADQEEVWKTTPKSKRYTIAGVRHIEVNGRLLKLSDAVESPLELGIVGVETVLGERKRNV